MWLSAIKLAFQAGSHIYKNKQRTKMLMADAQMHHAEKMAKGEAEYQGKLLEARQSDWKDEFILILLSVPIVMLGFAVWSDDPTHMEKMQLFFKYFSESKKLKGLDSLLSIVQMPKGIPVGTLAIGEDGAINAALLAASIIANNNLTIKKNLERFRLSQTISVKKKPQ